MSCGALYRITLIVLTMVGSVSVRNGIAWAQPSLFSPPIVVQGEPQDSVDSRLEQLEAEVRQLRAGQMHPYGGVRQASAENVNTLMGSNVELAGHELYSTSNVDTCFSQPSKSKFPTVTMTGVFHLDMAAFNQDQANQDAVMDIENGGGFRRARFAMKGDVTENVSYIMEFDMSESIPRFVDVWVNFAEVPGLGNLRIGRWRQPFGMSELTSIRELPFLERPAIFTFSPFRQTGLGFYDHNEEETVTWAVSGFRYPSDAFGNNIGDSGGWGLAGRVTLLPVYEDGGEELIHLGANYMFADPSENVLRFASPPEIQVTETTGGLAPGPLAGVPPFVDTGVMSVQNTNTFGLEAAGAIGGLYLQSEARWARVQMLDGSTQTFPGAYAHARYILTGEKLPYNKTGAVFGRVVPDDPCTFSGGGIGAWELAARWSYIDLNGVNLAGPGRSLNDLTFGVNWYLNKYTKIQFDYIHAFLKDPVLGKSNADVTAIRTQLDF